MGKFQSCGITAMLLATVMAASGAQSAFAGETELARIEAPDPMKVVISLEKQHAYVYRGTKLISSSRVSTGKRGHRTPAGIFSVLQKRRWHRSNIYSNAPMPYMQRLTWSGIALHQGYVPGYPASHGCIRLPTSFARQLFRSTDIGSHVIVTRQETSPRPVLHSSLPQPRPLQLVTMDEREALFRWIENRKYPENWIPLPARAPGAAPTAAIYAVSYGTEETAGRATPSLSPREASLQFADIEYDLEQLTFYANKSPEPLRVLITQREGRERVRDVQRLLNELGYDAGEVDGYRGRQTRSALRDFEKSRNMEETGDITDEVLNKLFLAVNEKPAPTGHIYVRQGFKKIFDAPINIADPEKPLGTHLFSVAHFEPWEKQARWLALTANGSDGDSAITALGRISLPENVRTRLEKWLTPGSSIIVSDGGLGPETGDTTEFIALTN